MMLSLQPDSRLRRMRALVVAPVALMSLLDMAAQIALFLRATVLILSSLAVPILQNFPRGRGVRAVVAS